MDLAVFIFDIDGFTTKLSQGSLMVWESRFYLVFTLRATGYGSRSKMSI